MTGISTKKRIDPATPTSKQSNLILTATSLASSQKSGLAIKCSIKNIGKSDTHVFLFPYISMQVLIKKNGMEKRLEHALLMDVAISKNQVVNIRAGESYVFTLEITKALYVWPPSGLYEVKIIYTNILRKIESIKVWTGRIESNSIQLEFH